MDSPPNETISEPAGGSPDSSEFPETTNGQPLQHAESPEAASDSSSEAPAVRRPMHELVHTWIPLAIVLASVLAALVGWRASVSEEHATHAEELSRQDLVQQQQQIVQDTNAVDADLRTFGQFAESSGLAHSLLRDADRVSGPTSDQLRTQGQADLGVARYLGKQIRWLNYAYDPSSPNSNVNLRSDGTYQPGHPYDVSVALDAAENADPSLHGLAPEELHRKALATRSEAVHLTGIAAVFIGVLMLLTLAALVSGPPKLWFVASGAALGAVGIVLFVTVIA